MISEKYLKSKFDLSNRVVIITGGCGLLGIKHAEAVAEFGAHPVLLDIVDEDSGNEKGAELSLSRVTLSSESLSKEGNCSRSFDFFRNMSSTDSASSDRTAHPRAPSQHIVSGTVISLSSRTKTLLND